MNFKYLRINAVIRMNEQEQGTISEVSPPSAVARGRRQESINLMPSAVSRLNFSLRKASKGR